MSWFKAKDLLDRTFEIGIILKGLDGILELLAGTLCWRCPRRPSTGSWAG